MKTKLESLLRTTWRACTKTRRRKILLGTGVVLLTLWGAYAFLYPLFFESYTGVVNAKLTFSSSVKVTPEEFDRIAQELTYQARFSKAQDLTATETSEFTRRLKIEMLMNTRSALSKMDYSHIKFFRNAGILQYEGPRTCLKCHATIKVRDYDGKERNVSTMQDILDSIHFKFQRMASGFTTYGYDGREVNAQGQPIPVGKIDRACGIPGSFSWTGWAALVGSKPKKANGNIVMRSEGCGQCPIGGNYHPATELMMPVGGIPEEAQQGIDCLICHSQTYDMNYKYVIKDRHGNRWNQDRTMRAAMTVTKPTNSNCLNCHQHNMGGDVYEHNVAAQSLGYENQRILHEGAKRGNAFSKEADVHAAAGVFCTDCHIPVGHKIPRGNKGTDLVGNDLPGVPVECERCHTATPHTKNSLTRVILNGHVDRVSCEACHIHRLEPRNVVLRDWVHPTWDEEEGLYLPTDIYRSGTVDLGFEFLWFNGNGTFLANALGTNPTDSSRYNPLMEQMTQLDRPEVRKALQAVVADLARRYAFDPQAYLESVTSTLSQLPLGMLEKRRQVVEDKIKPLMKKGKSRIYPFKFFNAMMHEDMTNQGPFGAMILPYDYVKYYETGKTDEAVKAAISHPIVKRMYQTPFKYYMMDEFMRYFGVDSWSDQYPLENGRLRNVEPHWMRQMGTLMVNHGIQKGGRKCAECHASNGIMDFVKLGYPPERVKDLQNLPELKLKYFQSMQGQSQQTGTLGRKPAGTQAQGHASKDHPSRRS